MTESLDCILKSKQTGSGLGNILAASSIPPYQQLIKKEHIEESKSKIGGEKKTRKRKRKQTGGQKVNKKPNKSKKQQVQKTTNRKSQSKQGRVKKLRKLYAIRRATF